mgnify:CR=1 FL=1
MAENEKKEMRILNWHECKYLPIGTNVYLGEKFFNSKILINAKTITETLGDDEMEWSSLIINVMEFL